MPEQSLHEAIVPETKLRQTVAALLNSYRQSPHMRGNFNGFLPNREHVVEIIDLCKTLIFPGYFAAQSMDEDCGSYQLGALLLKLEGCLSAEISHALCHVRRLDEACLDADCADCTQEQKNALSLARQFVQKLPELRELIGTDVKAAFEGDPAAQGYSEIILSYPGVLAVFIHRLAHELHKLEVPMIPRVMSEHAHSITGIDIHPGATIGPFFFIDHGTGVVIGETTVIGARVKLYQGVTLGALSTRGGQRLKGVRRHPTLGDDVTVYGGATILGGETVIGNGVTIGGNVFISRSVDPSLKVVNKSPELEFRN